MRPFWVSYSERLAGRIVATIRAWLAAFVTATAIQQAALVLEFDHIHFWRVVVFFRIENVFFFHSSFRGLAAVEC